MNESNRWGDMTPATGAATKYKGSPWLASGDVQAATGGFVVLTIADMMENKGVQFDKGRSEDIVSIGFEEMAARPIDEQKRMVLNRTNLSSLAKLFGPTVDMFIGKRIKVYAMPGIEAFDKITDGLRICGEGDPIPKPAQKAADVIASLIGEGGK